MSDADILKHQSDAIRAETIGRLTRSDMAEMGQYAKLLCQRRGACRVVGRILEAIWCRETHRRQSGGAVELSSFTVPDLMPGELFDVVNVVTSMTYEPHSETLSVLYDEILSQFTTQTGCYLILMQREIERKAAR